MFTDLGSFLKHTMWNGTRTNTRKVFIALAFLVVLGLVIFVYFCRYDSCRNSEYLIPNHILQTIIPHSDIEAYKQKMLPQNLFPENDLRRKFHLTFERDVIVFLHMQKTGGTYLGRHLVRNLNVESPCQCVKGRKRCDCYTKNGTIWLFSRYSTGWRCGLHADWTELNPCVDGAMNEQEGQHRLRR